MTLNVSEPELTEQLAGLVTSRLLDPLEILLGTDWTLTKLERRARTQSAVWAKELLGRSDRTANQTAARLIAALYPSDGAFDPPSSWWRTPFGQLIAYRIGHPSLDGLSYSTAGAMLGVTKQAVYDLVNRGKLARHEDGGVTSESVRLRLHQRST